MDKLVNDDQYALLREVWLDKQIERTERRLMVFTPQSRHSRGELYAFQAVKQSLVPVTPEVIESLTGHLVPEITSTRLQLERAEIVIRKLAAEVVEYIHAEHRGVHPNTVRRRNRELNALKETLEETNVQM